MAYTIDEHTHRFAAWAASRAASVIGYRFDVLNGVKLLNSIGFTPGLTIDLLPGPLEIDAKHLVWRKKVIDTAKPRRLQLSDGVAAKLINCYLKARFLRPETCNHPTVKALHPPIDAVLLKALARINFGGHKKQWQKWHDERWSKFDSLTYESVIGLIRQNLPTNSPLWMIEEHWQGFQKMDTEFYG